MGIGNWGLGIGDWTITHYPLPIPHYPLPIPYSPFPIPHSPFPIPHSPLPLKMCIDLQYFFTNLNYRQRNLWLKNDKFRFVRLSLFSQTTKIKKFASKQH
ncbi:MAG: hypothetical protein KME64_32725 [Scytonematopsis contorta HA4267-MV1]|nr:hypothetical protein [Scytonematopsis contorta HA4267-MV1]